MARPRPLTSATLPVYGLPSLCVPSPETRTAHPAQSGTLFPAIDKGCDAVPDVPLVFLSMDDQSQAASLHHGLQFWQLQIMAILAIEPGCSASVPEQKIATGTTQPEAIEPFASICSVFRFISSNLKVLMSKQGLPQYYSLKQFKWRTILQRRRRDRS